MSDEQYLQDIMGLIMYSGDAKGKAIEAIQAAKNNNFILAEEKFKEATVSLNTAHKSQTGLLTAEAQGEKLDINLLMIHGQDHLMTAITFIDLAKEIVEVYERIAQEAN
ncbi:PTS lactose/cellobiose transporter subunit IIA [Aerococcus urinae]